MKSGWRVILTVVLITILLGAICIGVGKITGGDMPRIYSVLDRQYNISEKYDWLTKQVPEAFEKAGFTFGKPQQAEDA